MKPAEMKTTNKILSVLNPFDLSPVDTLAENDETDIEDALTTAGVLMIAQKKHPIEIRDSLNAYLPPKLRTKDEE